MVQDEIKKKSDLANRLMLNKMVLQKLFSICDFEKLTTIWFGNGLECLSPPVIVLLTIPRRYFFCGSFLLLCFVLVFVNYKDCLVCSLQPCGHLMGQD